jgi:hypothetical protein
VTFRVPAAATLAIVATLVSPPIVGAQDGSHETSSTLSRDAAAPSTWKGAIADSIRLLFIEHTTRILFQEKTRRELGGPFFPDYARSLHVPRTWDDGDRWAVNYIGHPIHGAAAGYIWLDHEPGSHDPSLGFSKAYWASRARASAWAAAYSLQFEIGPLSEASIGNVGMRPGTTGWIDHVMTPVGAFGFMVAEDLVQRHVVTRIESWTENRLIRTVSRTILTPSRTLSYAAQGRMPWASGTSSRP